MIMYEQIAKKNGMKIMQKNGILFWKCGKAKKSKIWKI
jgi:hypothetical protein